MTQKIKDVARVTGAPIQREESLNFLKVPTAWALINSGVESFSVDFNETINKRNYIGNKNAVAVGGGLDKSVGLTQFAHKGDVVFDFIDDIMFYEKSGAEAESELLEVFAYRADTDAGPFPAKKSKVLISKGSNNSGDGGDQLSIAYDINFQGDPEIGTVTIVTGLPVFVKAVA